jgi:TetR/AcrR family transcriptional regulator, transcriptional repressor of bet genes
VAGKQRTPKFHRETPAVRREALVEATLLSLKQYGHEGTSIRRISATAGVSIGLINHHFQSKSELIAAAYETLAVALQKSMRDQAENASLAPRDRLSGFFRASFAPEILDPAIFSVWLVFWSMVMHSPEMRIVHDRTYRQYRATLEALLAALAANGDAPPFQLRSAAIALTALLDGLWVELSLSPSTFTARDAVGLCEDWVSALCSGSLPGVLMTRAGGRRPRAAAPAKRSRKLAQDRG